MYFEIAEALQGNPGKWAEWPYEVEKKKAYSLQANIRIGRIKAFPLGDYESTVIKGKLFVRYVGGAI
ncbi:hypothetical protein ACT17_20690 [Mycolicibacterium conceptionense]|nr:hypothetical protein AA982_29655 [Mycolicibacterium senegalense]KLO53806.1 hypothetical protein ABW05_22275 [Mycolicibacterium senegalense]KMV16382.1 hypothetical protein ACT17_20690 [Mycolicibacterium conceptionense]